jgi:toxin ParE1/3/4
VKRLRPTARAEADVTSAVDWYLQEASAAVAQRFLDAYDAALLHIARHPGTGSLRYAGADRETRFWLLDRFPYALFYVKRDDRIELLRVLHQSADLPAHLTNESDLS